MPEPVLRVVQLAHSLGLPLPSYATTHAAGMDLCAAIPEGSPVVLAPGDRVLVPTGLLVAIPEGFEGQVRARSGRALREGLGLPNAPGTIDADFRGELQVLLVNFGRVDIVIRRGERIAQLVIAPIARVTVTVIDSLEDTSRGQGGFGSTGR